MGRDLTTPVLNYPTLWAGEVITHDPCSSQGIIWRFDYSDFKNISYLENHFNDKVKFPTLGASILLKTEENPPTFPTCSPRGDSEANN